MSMQGVQQGSMDFLSGMINMTVAYVHLEIRFKELKYGEIRMVTFIQQLMEREKKIKAKCNFNKEMMTPVTKGRCQ